MKIQDTPTPISLLMLCYRWVFQLTWISNFTSPAKYIEVYSSRAPGRHFAYIHNLNNKLYFDYKLNSDSLSLLCLPVY